MCCNVTMRINWISEVYHFIIYLIYKHRQPVKLLSENCFSNIYIKGTSLYFAFVKTYWYGLFGKIANHSIPMRSLPIMRNFRVKISITVQY